MRGRGGGRATATYHQHGREEVESPADPVGCQPHLPGRCQGRVLTLGYDSLRPARGRAHVRESPRHRRCRHCLARRRRVRHRRGAPRAALPGGGRPERPGDAKQLLGSSQDEHAAAVRCYGKQLSALARPPRGRAPPASPPPPSTHCLRPCCTR